MEYVKKICPVCGGEFVVLKEVEQKSVYCTMECLLVSQRWKRDEISFLVPV